MSSRFSESSRKTRCIYAGRKLAEGRYDITAVPLNTGHLRVPRTSVTNIANKDTKKLYAFLRILALLFVWTSSSKYSLADLSCMMLEDDCEKLGTAATPAPPLASKQSGNDKGWQKKGIVTHDTNNVLSATGVSSATSGQAPARPEVKSGWRRYSLAELSCMVLEDNCDEHDTAAAPPPVASKQPGRGQWREGLVQENTGNMLPEGDVSFPVRKQAPTRPEIKSINQQELEGDRRKTQASSPVPATSSAENFEEGWWRRGSVRDRTGNMLPAAGGASHLSRRLRPGFRTSIAASASAADARTFDCNAAMMVVFAMRLRRIFPRRRWRRRAATDPPPSLLASQLVVVERGRTGRTLVRPPAATLPHFLPIFMVSIRAGWERRSGPPSFDVATLLQPLGLRMPESLRELATADRLCLRIPGLAVFYSEAIGSPWVGSLSVFLLTDETIREFLDILAGPNGPLRNHGQLSSSTMARAAIQPTSFPALASSLPSGAGEGQGILLTPNGPNLDALEPVDQPTFGGFADVHFYTHKYTGRPFALKTGQDTADGRRHILAEISFFSQVLSAGNSSANGGDGEYTVIDGVHPNIVKVVQTRAASTQGPMILMQKEPTTLWDVQNNHFDTNPAEVVRVLGGILTAVDFIHSRGFLHRDIKPENILISTSGEGVLADFGLIVQTGQASLRSNIGAGTPEYSAMEVATTGSVLASDLFSVMVCFLELMLSAHPFDGKVLMGAHEARLSHLEAEREGFAEKIEDWGYDLAELRETQAPAVDCEEYEQGIRDARTRLEHVRKEEWRLGVRDGDWSPSHEIEAAVQAMGAPLPFYSKLREDDIRPQEEREELAAQQAKGAPSKIFESAWVKWLPGSTHAPCEEGLERVVDFVLENDMLHPDPQARPQTPASLRELLEAALAAYETPTHEH